jgi:hypothetical protein
MTAITATIAVTATAATAAAVQDNTVAELRTPCNNNYGLCDRGTMARLLRLARDFSKIRTIKTGSGADKSSSTKLAKPLFSNLKIRGG